MTATNNRAQSTAKIMATILIDQGVDPKMIRKQMAEWNKRKKLKCVKEAKQETTVESNEKEPTSTSPKAPLNLHSETNDPDDYKAGKWSIALITR
mgnify:CR=1 FL=1